MKHSLQLKLSQHLTLTPQLQQSIKLLQLSTVELNSELERYLLENPLLERVDSASESGDSPATFNGAADYGETSREKSAPSAETDSVESGASESSADFGGSMDEGASYGSSTRRQSDDDEDSEYSQIPAAEPTLQEHLINQLTLSPLQERDRQLALMLIAHLDDDGYLTYDLDDLAALIAEHIDIEPEELAIALRHVQNMEPTGVGARSLSECLSLQLRTLPADTPQLDRAIQLAEHHLDALAARDFLKLKRILRCDDVEMKLVRELIVSLDPKPGRRFGSGDIRYVIPDVVVRKAGGKWTAFLNQEAMPKLRVNRLYADLLHKSRDSAGKNLTGQLQEARWLIKNIQQRFDTILRVTQAIVERQRHFFDHGDVAMRPLVLREIADQVGLHESTISRVTTQKYMLTPKGIFELKYFFGSSVSTDTGGACSATAIRALIKQLVQAEDVKKPLSDNRISDILAQQGIVVARRTVAKYREALQIQSASLRKSF
ncbi:MAG: RNA polymerase factor sigma-54 [Betaproteobacteria bacterium]|nr:RNA polymerase factor sigma-54 [Betaproteobacteria bacterium]